MPRREAFNEDYVESLFIPPLEGHHRFWVKRVKPEAEYRDNVVSLGNNFIIGDEIIDGISMRGRNSKLVDGLHYFGRFTENWTTLMGRSEMVALSAGPGKYLDSERYELLFDSWLSGEPIYKVATEINGALATSAGLTYGEWLSIGKPRTAKEAAEKLNLKYLSTLSQGESVTLGGRPNYSASPIWADTAMELLPSWVIAPEACPFRQIFAGLGFRLKGDLDSLDNPYSPAYYIDSMTKRFYGRKFSIRGTEFLDLTDERLMNHEEIDSYKDNRKNFAGFYIERVERDK